MDCVTLPALEKIPKLREEPNVTLSIFVRDIANVHHSSRRSGKFSSSNAICSRRVTLALDRDAPKRGVPKKYDWAFSQNITILSKVSWPSMVFYN